MISRHEIGDVKTEFTITQGSVFMEEYSNPVTALSSTKQASPFFIPNSSSTASVCFSLWRTSIRIPNVAPFPFLCFHLMSTFQIFMRFKSFSSSIFKNSGVGTSRWAPKSIVKGSTWSTIAWICFEETTFFWWSFSPAVSEKLRDSALTIIWIVSSSYSVLTLPPPLTFFFFWNLHFKVGKSSKGLPITLY